MVGPVPQGLSKFVLTAGAPNTALIPTNDLVGVTVVFITCSYREKDFIRIGYYVNNECYSTSPLAWRPEDGTEAPLAATDEELAAMVASGQGIGPHIPPVLNACVPARGLFLGSRRRFRVANAIRSDAPSRRNPRVRAQTHRACTAISWPRSRE